MPILAGLSLILAGIVNLVAGFMGLFPGMFEASVANTQADGTEAVGWIALLGTPYGRYRRQMLQPERSGVTLRRLVAHRPPST